MRPYAAIKYGSFEFKLKYFAFEFEFSLVKEQIKLPPLTVTLDDVMPRVGFAESSKVGSA